MCSTMPVDQDIYILLVLMLSTCTVCTCRQCLHTCAPAAPAMLLLRTWCLQRIDGGEIEDQCNALFEPDLERVFGQNMVNKRQLTPQHPHWAAGFHGKILFPVWPDRLPGLDPEEAQWHFAHFAHFAHCALTLVHSHFVCDIHKKLCYRLYKWNTAPWGFCSCIYFSALSCSIGGKDATQNDLLRHQQ